MILNFLPRLYVIIKKTFHISCLFCVEFCQDSLTLIERFIMLLRSRSRTRYICVLLLHWEYVKTWFPSISKCSAPTLGEDKNMFARFYQNKCSKFLLIPLLKISIAEKRYGLCKSKVKKWTQRCLEYWKQWVQRCPPEKRE